MEFSELVKKLECSTDEFYNALALYLEVNQEDFLLQSSHYLNHQDPFVNALTDEVFLKAIQALLQQPQPSKGFYWP